MAFRFAPDEFIVEEITREGTVLELNKPVESLPEPAFDPAKPGRSQDRPQPGKFTRFVLQKRMWNSSQALQAVAYWLHVKPGRLDTGGQKDRHAVTTQLCSAFAIPPERLRTLHVKDVQILGAWPSSFKMRMGELSGNRFTIQLTPVNLEGGEKTFTNASPVKLNAAFKKLNGQVPNYFGPQRFGSLRKNTHLIGFAILRGDVEEAVLNYLTFTDGNEAPESTAARVKLAKDKRKAKKFADALDYYPLHLKFERDLLSHLHAYPADFAGALRRLPRSVQLLFVHAAQSALFNDVLAAREKAGKGKTKGNGLQTAQKGDSWCPVNKLGFPDDEHTFQITTAKDAAVVTTKLKAGKAFLLGNVIGYKTKPTAAEAKILKKYKLKPEHFKLTIAPELSSAGTTRELTIPLRDFEVLSTQADYDNTIAPFVKVRFSLPSGAYATTALSTLLGLTVWKTK